MDKHKKILAILNIVWGSFGLIGCLTIIAVFGGILGFIQVATHHDTEARLAVPFLGIIAVFVAGILLLTSLPAVIAGIGLLKTASWARTLTLIVSVMHLIHLPFGTALGVYGLWVLLSEEKSVPPARYPDPPIRIP